MSDDQPTTPEHASTDAPAPESAPSTSPDAALGASTHVPNEAPVEAPARADAVADSTGAAAPDMNAQAAPGTLTDAERAAESAGMRYQVGDIVPATVSAVRDDGVDVDLGGGAIGVIPKSENPGVLPALGASVEGKVIRRQGGNGRLVLSPKRALQDRAWTALQTAFEQGTTVSGPVKDTVKGGYIVDLGLRAFLPESLVDVRRGSKLTIGEVVEVVVIECEKPAGRPERVVVDRRQVREKTASSARDSIVAQLAVGQRLTGRVTAVTNFGAFVDLGGAEGLIHVSQLAHRQVADPREVLSSGQEVEVVVLDIRRERGKIALSRKAALPDPFSAFGAEHKVGDLVYGSITSLAPFGAFVAIDNADVEGLIHISELSRYRVEAASEVVSVGEGVWVKILAIDPGKRRLSLSLRRAMED
jgi:small subunit ribosomal protein S1